MAISNTSSVVKYPSQALDSASQTLWEIAKSNKEVLTLSGWFTAQDVNDFLANTIGLENAVLWCRQNGVTKVYLEAFGRGLYADRQTLIAAKNRFVQEGFEVSSGVTTLSFGKDGFGNGWTAQCYTHQGTQEELQRIFEYTASLFDQIIIDDWYFTECQCDECITACGDQSWAKYYGDLMVKMSRERVMQPAHAVNPDVKVIIKFPQWYDQFHKRGYEVVCEPEIFDGVWAGTESRDFDYDTSRGYEIGYNAYFNMRWLESLGRVGGGWFDSGRTTEKAFVEQARHTVLGHGKEIILWCYSGMLEETTPGAITATPVANMQALSQELPGLLKLAEIVRDKPITGVHLLKPGNSEPFEEEWVCSFLGNVGIPFVPASQINAQAASAVFPVQALKAPGFPDTLKSMLNQGTPIVITDGLAKRLASHPDILTNKNLTVLNVHGSPKKLLKLTREELQPFRDQLLAPLGMKFDAPNKVELYLFGDNYFVVENINDEAVDVTLDLPHVSHISKALTLPEDGGNAELSLSGSRVKIQNLPPRTLIAVEYG